MIEYNRQENFSSMIKEGSFIAISAIFTLLIISYEPIEADNGYNGAAASAAASTSVANSALAPSSQLMNQNMMYEANIENTNPTGDALQSMKQAVMNAINLQPQLYYQNDVEEFLNDPTGWSSIRYLNQRSYNWRRSAKLAVKNFRWRKQMGINELDGSMFPCELFKLGLIFEHGVSNQLIDENGVALGGSPIIWLRLGALGNVVKHMEKLTTKRMASFAYNTVRNAEHKARGFFRKHLFGNAQPIAEGTPIIDNMSMKSDTTIQYILRAIAWYIDDWEHRHPPGTKATLILDFENTDFAFSSWSMGEFFVELDDHFPDLFDQILGFRYKAKLWSLHSPISMFNRIFKSRLSSSPETDSKLKFISNEPKLSEFVTRVDRNGFSMLPGYIYGDCLGAVNPAPATCQQNPNALIGSQLFDPQLLQAVENEFYQVCKPRIRV